VSDPQRYLVLFEHTEGTGYSAWVPDLPGCVAAADTREECEHLIREAIGLHLAGMREDGEPVPEPSSVLVAAELFGDRSGSRLAGGHPQHAQRP
jgi:predicted RNase H-like HicB family nuclease